MLQQIGREPHQLELVVRMQGYDVGEHGRVADDAGVASRGDHWDIPGSRHVTKGDDSIITHLGRTSKKWESCLIIR